MAGKCCPGVADDDKRGQLRVAAGHLSYAAHLTELLADGKEASREEAEYDAREGLAHLRKGLGEQPKRQALSGWPEDGSERGKVKVRIAPWNERERVMDFEVDLHQSMSGEAERAGYALGIGYYSPFRWTFVRAPLDGSNIQRGCATDQEPIAEGELLTVMTPPGVGG